MLACHGRKKKIRLSGREINQMLFVFCRGENDFDPMFYICTFSM